MRETQNIRSEVDVLREDVVRERALDRQKIAARERVEPQPPQKDRGEILRALLAANGGKMLAEGRSQEDEDVEAIFYEPFRDG